MQFKAPRSFQAHLRPERIEHIHFPANATSFGQLMLFLTFLSVSTIFRFFVSFRFCCIALGWLFVLKGDTNNHVSICLDIILWNEIVSHYMAEHFHFLKRPIISNLLIPKRCLHLSPNGTLHFNNTDIFFVHRCLMFVFYFNYRRMFPSLRVALSGLEKDAHYCVVLEMAPLSDCRYKFSGSQWVPAGGAEPQSAQRMYIHPDSPALGSHWQAQPVIFNKVKLTNNTLDSQGHVSIQFYFSLFTFH